MSNFPFKIETLLEQCGGNRDIGGVVLDEFLVQVDADIKELEVRIADGDWTQVGRVGHRLKGTAGVLGAEKLYSLCFAIEAAGKGGNADEIVKTYPELKTETERCVAAVPEARKQL